MKYTKMSCRAPVDRATLQPGRRVSKAGLESLRSLSSTERNVEVNVEEVNRMTSTPDIESRVGWV